MPPPTEVVTNYLTASNRIRARLERIALAAWTGLGSYRDADIDRLVDMLAPQVVAGQRTIAQLTDAYLAALMRTQALGVADAVVTTARGVPAAEVYRRPGVEVWTALSEGKPFATARDLGAQRLISLVRTDLQLAQRAQEHVALMSGPVGGYRRVLNGERDCMLCVIASTQRYHKADLKPIHPGCDCGVAPIEGGDPGQVINEALLEEAHDLISQGMQGLSDRGARDLGVGKVVKYADGTRLADYTDLILVREHGEYGPTLTWRADSFTGPGDLAN